jgi:hypothetical protein
MEQNRALSSEKNDLVKQIARDEEAMTSTIRLLKHTMQQNRHQFDDGSRPRVEGLDNLSQQSQIPGSDQKIETVTSDLITIHTANSAQPTSDTVTVKEEKQTSAQHASNDTWEVDLSTLAIAEMIGEGFFSKTYKGVLNGTTQVAVRTPVLGQVNATDFKEEAAVMKQLSGHPNVIKLYGTYLSKGPLYLIIEFMPHGTLYQFLHQKKQPLWMNFPKAANDMSTQIVNGMAHMEHQRCIHRNLSSHTILVGENFVVKVANFSYAKKLKPDQDFHEAPSNEMFKPQIRWSAPEVVNHRRFSSKSDVWSFGVLLYEIVTGGGVPYSEKTNSEIAQQIQRDPEGFRYCFHSIQPSGINSIMRRCMEVDPAAHPSFAALNKETENPAASLKF